MLIFELVQNQKFFFFFKTLQLEFTCKCCIFLLSVTWKNTFSTLAYLLISISLLPFSSKKTVEVAFNAISQAKLALKSIQIPFSINAKFIYVRDRVLALIYDQFIILWNDNIYMKLLSFISNLPFADKFCSYTAIDNFLHLFMVGNIHWDTV